MFKGWRISSDRTWRDKKNGWTFPDHQTCYDKAWAPGCWEVSGGAAMAGEDSKTAVLREIREETGLDVAAWDGGYLFTYRRDNPGEGDNYFVDVYRFSADFDESDIKLQEEETDGYLFASAEEIKKLGEEGKFLHYDSIRQAFV